MDLAEGAPIIGAAETARVYFGQKLSEVALNVATTITSTAATTTDNMMETESYDNMNDGYSATTLNDRWSLLWRLFFLMAISTSGSIANGFFLASFFTARELRQRGNIFLGCLGLSDLIVTSLVIPASIIIIVSETENIANICMVLQFLTQAATYSYSVFFMLLSIDLYGRLMCMRVLYLKWLAYPISFLAVLNLGVSIATAWVGVYYGLDEDYCSRQHHGNAIFRYVTLLLFYLIPFFVTISLLGYTCHVMKQRVARLRRFKRSHVYRADKELAYLHLGCYLLFVGSWMPYLVLIHLFPDAYNSKYYTFLWIALIRTAVTSYIYSVVNKHFHAAFAELTGYCCHKSTRLELRKRNANSTNGAKNILMNPPPSQLPLNQPLIECAI